jgi:hypothetical protein
MQEASELANSDCPIVKPVREREETAVDPTLTGSDTTRVSVLTGEPGPRGNLGADTVDLSGNAGEPTQTTDLQGQGSEDDTTRLDTKEDIPPNYADLPWPQLKKLAVKVSGGRTIPSRHEAVRQIENYLAQ